MSEKHVCDGCGRSFTPRGLRSHQASRFALLACQPPKSLEEQQKDLVRAEYEKILTAAIIKNGSLVDAHASVYGWTTMEDYEPGPLGGWTRATRHSLSCGIASTGRVEEDASWSEFAGTFASNDHYIHGMEVHGVTCNCGKITDRVFRWSAPVGEAIRIVMMQLVEDRVLNS